MLILGIESSCDETAASVSLDALRSMTLEELIAKLEREINERI